MTDPTDATLDEIRAVLAPGIAANAAFDGWSAAARDFAAESEGVDPGIAALAFPGGAVDMIDAWFEAVDAATDALLPVDALAMMPIRRRIAALVEARLDMLSADRESLRRAQGVLALPQNLATAARLGWRTVDHMWRRAGDIATDYNHYTKRATLLAVYTATMLTFVDDDSEGQGETRAFLDRRIGDIMRFEKAKAGFLRRTKHRPSLSRFVGRLRYPVV